LKLDVPTRPPSWPQPPRLKPRAAFRSFLHALYEQLDGTLHVLESRSTQSAAFAAFWKDEIERYRGLVKLSGAKVE
jgi:hypothetical protein